MSKITLDDGGNVWAKETEHKERNGSLRKIPNESNAPVYNYDILKLTGTNMVLSYPNREPVPGALPGSGCSKHSNSQGS